MKSWFARSPDRPKPVPIRRSHRPISGFVDGRIAVFASFSGAGGVERMVVNLVRGWADQGRSVDLLLARTEGPHLTRIPDSVDVVRLGARHTGLALPGLVHYLRRVRPAALLAAKDRAGRAALLARTLAGVDTRIFIRLGTHLSRALADKSTLARWLRYSPMRLLYPMADGVVAVSHGVAKDTARITRIPMERIHVVRNPVITPELATLAAEPCPHPWFRPDQPPVVLGVGRLQRQKDFTTLIRAFARLTPHRDWRLVILGDGGSRAGLETLVDELDLKDRIDLPGFAPNPYPYMKAAQLFVLSSAWEGSPNALTEAMALGTPVVATDCPSGPDELLDGGRLGPLVPVGDVEGLATAMTATLLDPPPAEVLKAAVAPYNQAESALSYLRILGV